MKVLFIYNGAEHIGIEYLSSFLKAKEHDVELAFDPAVFSGSNIVNNRILAQLFNLDDKIIKRAIDAHPDVIAFSVFTGNYRWCLKIAQDIKRKKPSILIIFGGVHATALPERVVANDCIDFVIIGEGEYPLSELLESIENNFDCSSIANLCYKRNGKILKNSVRSYIRNLDQLPFPDKELFYKKVPQLAENYSMITGRGCDYRCTYCSNDMYRDVYLEEKSHLRRRSPGNVIAELVDAKNRYGKRMKYVTFEDEVFTANYNWLKEFSIMYLTEIGLPFKCLVHPLTITEEKVQCLKIMGCHLVQMGIQSGSSRIRHEIFHRTGSDEKIIEAAKMIRGAGILLSVDNIFGAPSEQEDDLIAGIELYKKVKPDRLTTFWLTFYPETSIIDYAKKFQMLTDEHIENIKDGIIGYTHSTGSVEKSKHAFYLKYQVIYQLVGLIHNDSARSFFSKLLPKLPFISFIGKFLFLTDIVIKKELHSIYVLKYIFAKKYVP